MKTDILNFVEAVESSVNKAKPLIKVYIQNKANPLDERWIVYSTAPSYMFDKSGYYPDYTFNDNEIVWYDDHHIDRYQTADNVKIIGRYEEKMVEGSYDYDSSISKEMIDDLKEQMLQSGYRTWVNDW